MKTLNWIGGVTLLAAMASAPTARAESPMVEQTGRLALRTLQLGLEKMAGGRVEPAGRACIDGLPKDAYFGVLRQHLDRYSIEDQAQLDAFADSAVGRKYLLLSEQSAYAVIQVPLPGPAVGLTEADRQALKTAAEQPAVKTYLQSRGFADNPLLQSELLARTRELIKSCEVRRVPAPEPSAASSTGPAVASESRDAATGAIGAVHYVVGRIAARCLKLLERTDTPQQFVAAWRQRNETLLDAAAHYLERRLAEAKLVGGESQAAAIIQELRATVRANGDKTVDGMLNGSGDSRAACQRVVDLVEARGFDLGKSLPLYSEMEALAAWSAKHR